MTKLFQGVAVNICRETDEITSLFPAYWRGRVHQQLVLLERHAFSFIYRQQHIQSLSLHACPTLMWGNKWNEVPGGRHRVHLVNCKFSLAWHGMVWDRGGQRGRQIEMRVRPIKPYTDGRLQTDSHRPSSWLILRICNGEVPRDRQPTCIPTLWLISAHTIRFCFISDSVKSKGRGGSTGLQSPVRITILHSNSGPSNFTSHYWYPWVLWWVILELQCICIQNNEHWTRAQIILVEDLSAGVWKRDTLSPEINHNKEKRKWLRKSVLEQLRLL